MGVGDGQRGLVCYSPWGRKELDTTEWLNWTELNIPLSRFIHLPFGCFKFLSVINKVPINICGQFFFFNSFGSIPRRIISGSYFKSMFCFIKSDKLSTKITVPFCISTSNEWEFLLLHTFSSIWCCSCSCVCVHFCFNLQFSNDIWYWTSFHMLICHLYIFLDEISILILLYWTVHFLINEF